MPKQTKFLAVLLINSVGLGVQAAEAPVTPTAAPEQTIHLTDQATLETRLHSAGYKHFTDKTNLAGTLADQKLQPLELLQRVAVAVSVYEDACSKSNASAVNGGSFAEAILSEEANVYELFTLSYKRNIYKALLPDQPAALRNIHATFIKTRSERQIPTIDMLAGRMGSLALDKFNYGASRSDARL